MPKIDELIAQLCPEGVAVSKLDDLGSLYSGLSGKSKSDFTDGNAPFVSYLDIGNFSSLPAVIKSRVKVSAEERQNTIQIGDLLFTGSSEDKEGVGLTSEVEYVPSSKTYLNSFCFGFRPNADLFAKGYLKHLFRSREVRISVIACSNGVTRINISKKSLVKTEIPVPPIEVQREIVSILDKFTQLEAELEAELEARKSQFTYFVDQIFDLYGSHNAPSKPLQSVCRITRASGLEKSQLQAEGLPVVQYGEIHKHYDTVATSSRSFADASIANKLQKANSGDVILVTTSEDVKDVGNPLVWMGPTSIGVGGESLILQHDLDPVYLGMFFKSNSFYSQKLPYVNGSKVKRISSSNLQKILIPVPELRIQKTLGENLLALENLVKSANDGLPAEIAARGKQYEYYRNKLLTFKELEAA